jgi:hypothetical protein
MAKRRFVLRFRGDPVDPAEDRERIRNLPQSTVLHEASPRMVLIESDEQPLRDLIESLPGWVLAPEQDIPLPDTRQRIKRPPG